MKLIFSKTCLFLKLLDSNRAHVKLQRMTYENVNKQFFANINLNKH